MKRDMDLIREILIKIEEHEHGHAPKEINIDGYNDEQIGHHIYLMGQAGLLEVNDILSMNSQSPIAEPLSLTWEGHDFLDAIRNDTIWDKTKKKFTEVGAAMTIELIKVFAINLSRDLLGL